MGELNCIFPQLSVRAARRNVFVPVHRLDHYAWLLCPSMAFTEQEKTMYLELT